MLQNRLVLRLRPTLRYEAKTRDVLRPTLRQELNDGIYYVLRYTTKLTKRDVV